MTLYSGYIFFVCLAAACIPAIALGIAERPVRNYALAASLFFVTAALAKHPVQLAYFVAYFIWQLITVMSYMHIYRKRGRDSRIYHAMLDNITAPARSAKAFSAHRHVDIRVYRYIVPVV